LDRHLLHPFFVFSKLSHPHLVRVQNKMISNIICYHGRSTKAINVTDGHSIFFFVEKTINVLYELISACTHTWRNECHCYLVLPLLHWYFHMFMHEWRKIIISILSRGLDITSPWSAILLLLFLKPFLNADQLGVFQTEDPFLRRTKRPSRINQTSLLFFTLSLQLFSQW
jgi:hypothetical protein